LRPKYRIVVVVVVVDNDGFDNADVKYRELIGDGKQSAKLSDDAVLIIVDVCD